MKHNTATALLAASGAIAAMMLATPDADAATDVVYLGGTGTGMPVIGTPNGTAYAHVLVPDVDQITNVVYDGSPIANPQASVPVGLAAVKATNDPTVIIGVSKGAQLAHGVEARDTRTDTTYVYVGDPDGQHGISRTLGLSPKPVEPTHDTVTINAEYDGIGDMPDRFNPLAIANAAAGWAFIHTKYGAGGVDDPLTSIEAATVTVRKNRNGTTSTTKLIPTKHLPILKPLRDTEKTLTHQTRITDAIEGAIRPTIDAGYSRNDKPAKQTGSTTKTVAPSKEQAPDRAPAKTGSESNE